MKVVFKDNCTRRWSAPLAITREMKTLQCDGFLPGEALFVKKNVSTIVILFCCIFLLSNCTGGSGESSPTILEMHEEGKYTIRNRDKFYDVFMTDVNNIWVVGQYGLILHSSDQGSTWQPQRSTTTEDLYAVEFLDNDTGWVVGAFGTIVHTSDGGKTWEKQQGGTENHLYALNFIDEREGWAVGYYGTVIHTMDGGNRWEDRSTGLDVNLNAVSFINRNEGWTGGEFGTILHTTTGGTAWEDQTTGRRSIFGIHFTDAQHGLAVGLLGTMLSTSNGGNNWISEESGTVNTFFDIVVDRDTAFSVGEKGTVVRTLMGEDGSCLKSVSVPVETNQWLAGLCLLSREKRSLCAVGSRGTVLYSTDDGFTWINRGIILK
jgi:photosystem II stability/assembly factor-like uncharacterized protein